MPIYEYVCRACGAEIEKLQALSDAPLTDCAECGESALKRKISAAGFRLAGSGWYETDFKKDGRRNIAGESKPEKSGAKSEGAKSEGAKSKDSGSGSGASKSGAAAGAAAGG